MLEAIVFLCVLLFVYTAIAKLLAYDRTALQLARSSLFTGSAGTVAWTVPMAELLIAALVAWPRSRIWGLYAFTVLMVLFTGYVVHTLFYSDFIPCSCGGALERLTWSEHLIFNASFIALGVTGIVLQRKDTNKDISKRKEVKPIQ